MWPSRERCETAIFPNLKSPIWGSFFMTSQTISICCLDPTRDRRIIELFSYLRASRSPYFRLLRNEVESLVNEKYGNNYLKNKKLKNKLAQVSKEINRLKKQLASLERKKAELLEKILMFEDLHGDKR